MKLDELLPVYDVAAQYDTLVQASVAATVTALEQMDFSELRLTKLLMRLRTLGRRRPEGTARTQVERLQRVGFIELADVPQREIVFGIVGRFWKLDSGIITGLSPEEFIAFHTDGYAKAVWNFAIAPESKRTTRVTTETRVQAFGRSARWKFRAYWLVVGPFSGIIRKEMLAMIKRNAEAIAGGSYSTLAS